MRRIKILSAHEISMNFFLEIKPGTIFIFLGLMLKYIEIALIIALLAFPLIGNSFIEILISLVS